MRSPRQLAPNWDARLGPPNQIRIGPGDGSARLDGEWLPWPGGRVADTTRTLPERIPPDHPWAPNPADNTPAARGQFPAAIGRRRLAVVLGEPRWRDHLTVFSAGFSRCGRWLASLGPPANPTTANHDDNRYPIAIWETATGHLVRRIDMPFAHSTQVCGMADSTLIVSHHGALVLCDWDALTPRWTTVSIPTLGWSIGWQRQVRISPDGRWLGFIHAGASLFDLRRRVVAWEVSRQCDSICFLPDSQSVLIGNATSYATQHDIRSGRIVRTAKHRGSVALSPDGRWAASRRRTVTVWDMATDETAHVHTAVASSYRDLQLASDGVMISRPREGLWLQNAWTGETVARLPLEETAPVVLSPNGRLAVLGDRGALRLLDPCTAKEPFSELVQIGPAVALEFTPDSRTLVGLSRNGLAAWRVTDGGLLWQRKFRYTGTARLAIAPDGQRAVTSTPGAGDSMLRIWSLATGDLLQSRSTGKGHCVGLAFGADSGHLDIHLSQGSWRRWVFGHALTPGQPVDLPRVEPGPPGFACSAISPDQALLAVSTSLGTAIYSVER